MGHHSCCSKQKVRRGLWSPEEDEKLINYITTFGHGCWSSVPRHAGLQRCGKSCRLRWINYLRPDLKRGNFSHQEESLIIEHHRTLGNRWAQIARHLPGRTDNEVKNFWNSSIKKELVGDGTGLARNGHKFKYVVDCSSIETPSIHMKSSNPLASYQVTGAFFDQSSSLSSSILMPKLCDIIDMAEHSTTRSQNKGINDVANASYFTSAPYHHIGGPNVVEGFDGMIYLDSIMASSHSMSDHLQASTSFPSNWEVKY